MKVIIYEEKIMKKKTVGITIDVDLLEKSKAKIPNLSKFVEYCLKNYLGEIQGLVPTWRQQELVDTIAKCQLELYLMNEKEKIDENKIQAEKEEIDLTWRKLFKEYRMHYNNDLEDLKNAAEVFNITIDELIDILDITYAHYLRDRVDITSWPAVYAAYGSDDD